VTGYCPIRYYFAVAEKAMSYDYLHAEQVGFLVPPRSKDAVIGLEMAGGEFCGNATLSAAACAVYKGLTDSQVFYIDSSGSDKPIKCRVEKVSDYCFNASSTMPKAKRIESMEFELSKKIVRGSLLEFEGISHFVLEAEDDFAEYMELIKALNQVVDASAIGIIPYRKLTDKAYKIKPFVHVKAIDSNVFEQGCGSGSLALGIYLKQAYGISKEIEVDQPGGIIRVGLGDEIYIATDVKITCEGRMLI